MDKIDEIEIELLEGDKGALLQLAAEIAAQVPLFVEKRSKFARGLALRGIASDEEPLADKLGNGLIKAELLAAIAAHGEQLFALKNAIEANVSEKILKALRRELLVLRSLTALADVSPCALLEEGLALVNEVRCLLDLQALWQLLQLRGGLSGRTSLQKKLSELTSAALEELQLYAEQGRFTAIIFALTSQVYAADVADESVESRVRASLKEWQQELTQKQDKVAANAEAALEEENEQDKPEDMLAQRLLTAENICALARCCNLKAAAKAAKKQRRQLNKQALLAAWQETLANICELSSSKLLYREAGMVLGYLLAKA